MSPGTPGIGTKSYIRAFFVGGGARGPPDVTKNGSKWFRVYLV